VLDINPGSFIVSKAETSPVAGDVGKTFKENVFTILKVEAIGEPVQVRSLIINLDGTHDRSGLTNLKLIYNGSTIAQVVTPAWNILTGDVKVTLTAPITLSPGTPAYISIAADSVGTQTPDATYVLGLSGVAEAISGLGTVSAKTVSTKAGSLVQGNTMTVGDVEVTVTAVPRGGTNIFPGQVSAELASFTLDHNLSETVSLTKLGVDNGFARSGVFTNFAIYDDQGVAISDKIVSVPTGALSFNLKTPLKIDADASVKVVLRADVASTAVSTDTGSFSILASGPSTGSFALTTALGTEIPVKTGVSSTIYTVADGSLIKILAVQSSARNLEDYINAPQGAVQVPIAAFKLTNDNLTAAGYGAEPVTIKKLYLASTFSSVVAGFDPTGDLGTAGIKNITIINNYDKSVLGKAEYLEAGAAITLTAPLVLGNSDSSRNADIVVLADVVSTARRGGTYQVTLGRGATTAAADIEYQTQSTGRSGTASVGVGTAGLSSSTLVVVPTTVTVTSNTTSNVTNHTGKAVAGTTLASFTFTNNGTTAVVVDQLKLKETAAGAAWNTVTVQLVKNGSTLLGSAVALSSGVFGLPTAGSTTDQLRIEAGSSVKIDVRAVDVTGAPIAETSIALSVLRGDQTAKNGTTFVVPNDAPTSYLIEDDAVSNVVYFIHN
jgi:hypothetical protein